MYSEIPLGLRLSRLFNKHSRHFAVRHLSLVAVLLWPSRRFLFS